MTGTALRGYACFLQSYSESLLMATRPTRPVWSSVRRSKSVKPTEVGRFARSRHDFRLVANDCDAGDCTISQKQAPDAYHYTLAAYLHIILRNCSGNVAICKSFIIIGTTPCHCRCHRVSPEQRAIPLLFTPPRFSTPESLFPLPSSLVLASFRRSRTHLSALVFTL